MPVKDWKRYPADWQTISLRIREREGWRCKWCQAPDFKHFGRTAILRAPEGFYCDPTRKYWDPTSGLGWHDRKGFSMTVQEVAQELNVAVVYGPDGHLMLDTRLWECKVVLTVAHLGTPLDDLPGDKHNKMDTRDENLAALCQRDHLIYDLDEHQANRRKTLVARKATADCFPNPLNGEAEFKVNNSFVPE